MKFNRGQAVSFKAADDGDYLGVLVGFSYIGIQSGGKYGDKPKVMLRWELHDLTSPHDPCVDDEDLIHVVTQTFGATIAGDQSWLYKCLVAHGLAIPGGGCTDSQEWYGKVAQLKIESVAGSRGDKMFMNVADINKLDHQVKITPTLKYEHWEAEDQNPPPTWARSMIERSSDIHHRAGQSKPLAPAAPGPPRRPPGSAASQGAYQQPMAPAGGYRPPGDDDDDDIPFVVDMNTSSPDDNTTGRHSWIARIPTYRKT